MMSTVLFACEKLIRFSLISQEIITPFSCVHQQLTVVVARVKWPVKDL